MDGAVLTVTSEVAHPDEEHAEHKEGTPIEQSDKPRAGSTPHSIFMMMHYLVLHPLLQCFSDFYQPYAQTI